MQVYSCSLTLQLKLEVNHNLLSCIQFEPEYMYTVASNCLVLFMFLFSQVSKSHILAYLVVCLVVFVVVFLQWNDVYNGVHSF